MNVVVEAVELWEIRNPKSAIRNLLTGLLESFEVQWWVKD